MALLRWTDWTWDPAMVAALVLTAVVYLWLLRRFSARGRQRVFFWAGLGSLGVALLSPLDKGAHYLFTLHMVQHMVFLMVAPPLLAQAVPASLIGWLYQRPPLRRILRFLWSPVSSLVLYNGVLIFWHFPAAYDATLQSPWIHALEHLSLVGAGLVFWGVIVSPAPSLVRASLGLRLGLVVGVDIVNFALGFTLTSAGEPLYEPYTAVPRLWGLTPLEDVKLGGALMWVMGQMMYAVPVLLLLYAILRREGDRGESPRAPGTVVKHI